jgi:hypothetical protein
MRTRAPFQLVFACALPTLLGWACSPPPTNDALGWNGRGMTLPADLGSGGNAGGASGGANGKGGVTGTGAAGMGAAGTTGPPGTGGGGASGGTTGLDSGGGSGGSGGAAAGSSGTGTAGTGGTGGTAGATSPADAGVPLPGGPPVGATCHLDVVVTTHSGGGNHQPKNVDAIWIQNAGGTFVKSLYVMARNEIQHLNAWNAATTAAGLSRNRVDAVTGASLSGYGTRMASWNCTDVNQKLVASGGYQVCFDLNDGNGTDKHACDNLTLGATATTLMPPDALPCFTGRVLTYKP